MNDVVLESQLEYLSLNKVQRFFYKISHFFTSIPNKLSNLSHKAKVGGRSFGHGFIGLFQNFFLGIIDGDWKTRLSLLLMGSGLTTRRQKLRGTLYFAFEIIFILFMCLVGVPSLSKLGTLGVIADVDYLKSEDAFTTTVHYDNSFTILLYSIITIFLILMCVFLYYNQFIDGYRLQKKEEIGKYASDKDTIKNVFDKSYDKTLLFIPIGGLLIFTALPIVVMVLIAFTNYDYLHYTPSRLFDWVGMYNFETVFSGSGIDDNGYFLKVFLQVLLWTLIWAFFATFSNFFLGMIVAMIINLKGIKLKKLWRSILVTTIAVPSFISLLLVSNMFSETGLINSVLQKWGWIKSPIPFLQDPLLAKFMIIIINMWIGIPYTMLITTGLLMNIPEDLYESARIDGASPIKMYFKITLPYMFFVMGPSLISTFVGNINNFNVIFFLSGGGPSFSLKYVTGLPSIITNSNVGQTDLLITWIYKVTTANSFDYGMASVLGLLVFVVVAIFSMITYNNTSSNKDEEAFQ